MQMKLPHLNSSCAGASLSFSLVTHLQLPYTEIEFCNLMFKPSTWLFVLLTQTKWYKWWFSNSKSFWQNAQRKYIYLLQTTSKFITAVRTEFTEQDTIGIFTNTQDWQCWHYCQLCIQIYLQFSFLFMTYDVSKCDIRYQGMQ